MLSFINRVRLSYPSRVTTAVLKSPATAKRVANALIDRSAWFQIEPRPDDEWEVMFKTGEGLPEIVEHAANDSGA